MISYFRTSIALSVLISVTTVLSACGDDGGSGDSASTRTPFIAPEAFTTEDALSLLAEIETMVREPSRALVAVAQVPEAQVQERSGLILSGRDDVSGLDDVRISLETEDRVGAGEYLFNVVSMDIGPFSEPDTNEINEATLDEIDVTGTFDPDHENGMNVSGIYKDAVTKMLRLWYGLVGVAIGTLIPVAFSSIFILFPAACRRVGVPVVSSSGKMG